MKKAPIYMLMLTCAVLAGCATTRSISHSEYPERRANWREGASDPAFRYQGELSEFDVLGIPGGGITSEADIRRALETSKPVRLRPGSSILLIQSGTLFPDGAMVTEMSKHFRVVPFSGVPTVRKIGSGVLETQSPDPESYSKSLRLTAARGGTDFIVCYWGMLESENDLLPTKTVSWVPLVHWLMPAETRHMRIQLKVALVDVRSGNWSVFSPKPFADARITTSPRRAAVDQKQVDHLKALAYEASVAELVQGFN
jgi:hypothetical protein